MLRRSAAIDTPALYDPSMIDSVLAVGNHVPGLCGPALKKLRARAGFTQRQVASAFHRNHSAVANWESEHSWPPQRLMLRVLEFIRIPTQVLQENFSIKVDADLDPTLYLKGDPVEIEFQYFTRRRGQVLDALANRAEEGSDPACKLFMEWMFRIEAAHAAQSSAPRQVSESKASAAWTRMALRSKDATPVAPIDGQQESVSSHDTTQDVVVPEEDIA